MTTASVIMRVWGVVLVLGMLLVALPGCGHNPNHDIDMEQARAAANRVHKQPDPGVKMEPGAGG